MKIVTDEEESHDMLDMSSFQRHDLNMSSHPSYGTLSAFIKMYPRLSGCLFQVYNDLLHGQRWEKIQIVELPECGRVALRGEKPETKLLFLVVPCYLHESLSLRWFTEVFKDLGDAPELYLAITSEDSSVVYYRISNGIVKPPP